MKPASARLSLASLVFSPDSNGQWSHFFLESKGRQKKTSTDRKGQQSLRGTHSFEKRLDCHLACWEAKEPRFFLCWFFPFGFKGNLYHYWTHDDFFRKAEANGSWGSESLGGFKKWIRIPDLGRARPARRCGREREKWEGGTSSKSMTPTKREPTRSILGVPVKVTFWLPDPFRNPLAGYSHPRNSHAMKNPDFEAN